MRGILLSACAALVLSTSGCLMAPPSAGCAGACAAQAGPPISAWFDENGSRVYGQHRGNVYIQHPTPKP